MLQPLVIFVSLVMTIRASAQPLGKRDGFPSYEGFKKAFQTSSSFLPITTEDPIGDSYDDLDSSDYADILERVSFYGQWLNVGGPSQLFGYFEKSTGYMSVQDADSDESDTALLDLNIILYDGRFVDQKFVQIEIQTPVASLIFNQTNASLSAQQLNVTASLGNDNNVRQTITLEACLSDIDIYFLDIKANQPFTALVGKNINDVGIQISLQSANCSIAVLSEILQTTYMYQDSLMIYVSLMVCSAIVGMISSNKLLAGFPDSVTKLSRICVWSIWLVNAWDFYLFLYHIALAVTLSGWLMLVALAFFVLSIISQTKLVYGIYVSSNRRGSYSSLASGFKFFALYYGLLYLLVFSYSYLSNSIWSVLSSSFYLTPQIIQVFLRGRKYKFNFWHILGLGVTRIAFVGYIKVASGNIFKLSPDYRFVAIYAAIIFGQVTTLSLQRILPKFCLTPKPFRYLVKVTDSQEKEEICPICMDILQDEPFSAKKGLLLEDEKTIMVMQTPCKHRFHEDCLVMWMKTKLECPSCRQVVPSLNNEEVD